MTDRIYGIIPPRILKGWEPCSMDNESARQALRKYLVPEGWGGPIRAVAWERANGDIALIVAEYPNGRRVELRRQGHDFATVMKWWSPPPSAREMAAANAGTGLQAVAA